MSYHQGFLYISNAYGNPTEVINEARTAANLRTYGQATTSSWDSILTSAGCTALSFEPCTMATDGSVLEWQALSTTATSAPWYDTVSAVGGDTAYGFYIEEWTGLDGNVYARSSVPTGWTRRGSYLGPLTAGQRTMMLNVILVGASDAALNHLFRWLEAMLTLNFDATSTKPSIWLMETCSTSKLVRLDNVGLVDGPKWESPPVEYAGCHIRRASFTLVAEDPCFYRDPTSNSPNTCTTANMLFNSDGDQVLPCGANYGTDVDVTYQLTPAAGYDSVSPLVTITSSMETNAIGSPRLLPPLRIAGYVDLVGGGSATSVCSMQRVGAVGVTNLLAGRELKIDFGARRAWVRNPYGSDTSWQDGISYLSGAYFSGFDDPTANWWISAQGALWVVVDQGYRFAGSGPSGSTLTSYTVTVGRSARFGCGG